MNKKFSQGFIKDPSSTFAAVIVKDSITQKFLILTSNEEAIDESDFKRTINCKVDLNKDITQQLVKELYGLGVLTNSYREVSRNNRVSFSFADDTPGYVVTDVCFYVEADIPNLNAITQVYEGYDAALVSFNDFASGIIESPISGYETLVAVSHLTAEYKFLQEPTSGTTV